MGLFLSYYAWLKPPLIVFKRGSNFTELSTLGKVYLESSPLSPLPRGGALWGAFTMHCAYRLKNLKSGKNSPSFQSLKGS